MKTLIGHSAGREAFAAFKTEIRETLEAYLEERFSEVCENEIRKTAEYVALAGGHRWRAIAAVAAGRIFSEDALDITLPGACGVELAHAASLVLDDLPSMDDADLRRGKKCVHLIFPQWAVDLTPTFLLNMAYSLSLENTRVSCDRNLAVALELGKAGASMFAGQAIDITQPYSDNAVHKVLECYELKSAALYGAATKAGALLCGGNSGDCSRLERAGILLGLSYQLMDDIADMVATAKEVGKNTGKDSEKLTVVDLLGIQETERKSRKIQAEALECLDCYGQNADLLRHLILEASFKEL